MILGAGEIVLLLIVGLGFFIPVIALVDIMKSNFRNNDKLLWVLIVIFMPVLGPILYFTMGRKNRI